MTVDLGHYTPEHRAELEALLASPEWQEALASGLIEEVKAGRVKPGKRRDFIGTVVDHLLAFNEERVGRLIAQGDNARDRLFQELSRWPDRLEGQSPRLSFLGLNVTAECNFDPRCIYCNQPCVQASVGLEGWKRVVADATSEGGEDGPYIYITGGEPLVLAEQVWGDDGLVRFATERGAAVNLNTNGILLTPEVALRLVKAGLEIMHISLDAPDRALQGFLFGGDRLDQVLRGIYNVQLARDIIGVSHPLIHTNCVLTNRNLDLFPHLFAFILDKRKETADRSDPFNNDLFPHVIPVGGDSNDWLRPSALEFRRFYEEVWPLVCEQWDRYQDRLGVPKEKRGVLFGYFSNPFLRVKHEGGLDAYVKTSAEGRYGALALPQHCYVAPTQATFTPDGDQYRCGSHAIRHLLPIGNVKERGVYEGIREGVAGLADLPDEEHCHGCALATLHINQAVEKKLAEKLDALLSEAEKETHAHLGPGLTGSS